MELCIPGIVGFCIEVLQPSLVRCVAGMGWNACSGTTATVWRRSLGPISSRTSRKRPLKTTRLVRNPKPVTVAGLETPVSDSLAPLFTTTDWTLSPVPRSALRTGEVLGFPQVLQSQNLGD